MGGESRTAWAAGSGLTDEQIARFRDEGWLLLPDLFAPADLQPLIDELCCVIDRLAAEQHAAGALSDPHAGEGFTTRLTRITAENETVFQRLLGGQHAGEAMFELIRHPRLLAVAESLLGPELVASAAYRIRPKLPNHARGVVPWHQDSGYFEAACDDSLILTVWIPLVDATVANGCLEVLPRSHRGPVVRHIKRPDVPYLEIAGDAMPAGEPVAVEVPRGGALLLTNRTAHRSTENTVDEIRWSVDIRYQGADAPSTALPEPLRDEALATARARAGDDAPAVCYAPEADFLVRSRRRPEAVVDDWEAFARIRREHPPGPAPRRWE